MMKSRGRRGRLVYLIDEGSEVIITRQNQIFACPDFFIDYPPLVFTSILNIDLESNNFPSEAALSEKAHASKKSTFICLQIGTTTFRGSPYIIRDLPQRKPLMHRPKIRKTMKILSKHNRKIENLFPPEMTPKLIHRKRQVMLRKNSLNLQKIMLNLPKPPLRMRKSMKYEEEDSDDDEMEDLRYGQKDSDNDEMEAIEEDHAPDMNVSMPQNENENLQLVVQEVQNSVPITTEVIDDALCSLCNKRTFLPLVYYEKLVFDVVCDDCLIIATGHAECEVEPCTTCEKVGNEVSYRADIKKNFADGTLVFVDEPEKTLKSAM